MGMGTNILIFCLLFSFGMQIYCTPGDTSCPYQTNYNKLLNTVPANLKDQIYLMSSIAGLGILVGVILFPNPYIIFGAFAVAMLLFPIDVFTGTASGLPGEISGLIGGMLLLAYALAIVSWYKGGDVP